MKLFTTMLVLFVISVMCVSVYAAGNNEYTLWNQQTIKHTHIIEEYWNCGLGTYFGFPNVAMTENGNLVAVWYNGKGHMLGDSYVEYSISTDMGYTWSVPSVLYDKYGPKGDAYSSGSPCGSYNWSEIETLLHLCPNGDTICIVDVFNNSGIYGPPANRKIVAPYLLRTTDNGSTWSCQGDIMELDDFFVLEANNYNSVIYVAGWGAISGLENISLFKSMDNGLTWSWVSTICSYVGMNTNPEPGLVIFDNGTFYVKLRWSENDYYSYDEGLTWIAKPDTPYAEKDCSMAMFDSDTIIMTIETSRSGDSWNEIWFSDDFGRTWGDYILLDAEGHDAYQDVVMIEDNWAYVVWHAWDYMYGAYITEGNTLPVAVNDSFTISEASILSSDVLRNDTDADGDSLMAILDTNVTTGILVLDINGSFVYTAPVGFSGNVSFTYYATDGRNNSNLATVTIHITPALCDSGGYSSICTYDDGDIDGEEPMPAASDVNYIYYIAIVATILIDVVVIALFLQRKP